MVLVTRCVVMMASSGRYEGICQYGPVEAGKSCHVGRKCSRWASVLQFVIIDWLRVLLARNLLPNARGGATMCPTIEDAGVTQLVEYLLPKQAVVGSSPIARSEFSQ